MHISLWKSDKQDFGECIAASGFKISTSVIRTRLPPAVQVLVHTDNCANVLRKRPVLKKEVHGPCMDTDIRVVTTV